MSALLKVCLAAVGAISCVTACTLIASANGPDPAGRARAGPELIAQGRIAGGTSWTLRTARPSDGDQWCLRYHERTPRSGADSTELTCGRGAGGRPGSALYQIDCLRERLVVFGGARGVAAVELRDRRRHTGRTFAPKEGEMRDVFFVAHLPHYRRATFVALDENGRHVGRPVVLPRLAKICRPDTGILASFPFNF